MYGFYIGWRREEDVVFSVWMGQDTSVRLGPGQFKCILNEN